MRFVSTKNDDVTLRLQHLTYIVSAPALFLYLLFFMHVYKLQNEGGELINKLQCVNLPPARVTPEAGARRYALRINGTTTTHKHLYI